MYVSNKIKKYVVDNVSDLPSAGNKHISNMCVNCECSYHVLRDIDGCSYLNGPNDTMCSAFVGLGEVYNEIDNDVEEVLYNEQTPRKLIDPLDDNAMIMAIKKFARRNNVAIVIAPNKSSGYSEFNEDINKIVNDNFWGIV